MNIRQAILVREDLDLPRGLLCAQVAHIHAQFMINLINASSEDGCKVTEEEKSWLKSPYIFVYGVKNVELLHYFIKKASSCNVKVYDWSDVITLPISDKESHVFRNVDIGCSLGPADSDEIKEVIGSLPLLR